MYPMLPESSMSDLYSSYMSSEFSTGGLPHKMQVVQSSLPLPLLLASCDGSAIMENVDLSGLQKY